MQHRTAPALISLLALALMAPGAVSAAGVNHLFNLSDFSGTVPYSGGRLVADTAHQEIYVIAGNQVRVFNDAGMEIFGFRHDSSTGLIRDLAVEESGDMLILTQVLVPGTQPAFRIWRCDYRGRTRNELAVSGTPEAFAGLAPDRMRLHDGELYVASRNQKSMIVVDARTGAFKRGYDLAELIRIPEEKRSQTTIVGFAVSPSGKLLLTVPTLFRAFVVSPDGQVASFGKPGSTPGSFSVIGGIAGDDLGRYFVSDRGRSVVMVFDERFKLVVESGSAGQGSGRLLRPDDIAVASDRLYVTQMGNRGVAAFAMSF